MTCRKFRKLVSEYVDGEISSEAKNGLLGHLGACAVCGRELELYGKISKLFSARDRKEMSPYFESKLSARLRGMKKPSPLYWYFRLAGRAVPVAALVLLLAAGIINRDKLPGGSRENGDSMLLVDSRVEAEFENELMKLYFNYDY